MTVQSVVGGSADGGKAGSWHEIRMGTLSLGGYGRSYVALGGFRGFQPVISSELTDSPRWTL